MKPQNDENRHFPAEPNRLIRIHEVLKIVPVSRSCWWSWVATGKAPAPTRLSKRCTCWRYDEVVAFTANRGA